MINMKKARVMAMIMLIVLLLSNVNADRFDVGSKISAHKIEKKVSTIEKVKTPFYFEVKTEGAYEVYYDIENKKMDFVLIDSNTRSGDILLQMKVLLDPKTYSEELNHQTGILSEQSKTDDVALPLYEIREVRSDSDEEQNPKLYNVYVKIGDLTLDNKYGMDTRPNLYFFTPDIIYQFKGFRNTAMNDVNDSTKSTEAIITRILIAIGDVFLLNSIHKWFGKGLSMSTLIFNQYDNTKLDFYNSESSNPIMGNIKGVVNGWYNVFLTFTYVAYVIILIYIGIMVITTSGTSKQDKAKSFIGYWVIGLLMLNFLPNYIFPYVLKANDAVVAYLAEGSTTVTSYYNLISENPDVILGGDSTTSLIESLEAKRLQSLNLQAVYEAEAKKNTEEFKTKIESMFTSEMKKFKEAVFKKIDNYYDTYRSCRKNGMDHSKAYTEIQRHFQDDMKTLCDRYEIDTGKVEALYKAIILTGAYSKLMGNYQKIYDKEVESLEYKDQIETLQGDIMGVMRSYAGMYGRVIFALLWYVLLFQFIGLLVLYYKRLFMIAILIAIFPIIMLFYCIDKMADGTAQTFQMWMKEFLSNVFIQSIHAVIYVLLVELGLDIYKHDGGNWIFLVAAMLLILPAEAILKTIFNLNGSTLSKVGGMFERATIAIGAMASLARAGKGSDDASVQAANQKRFNKLQNSQKRADSKANARRYRGTYNRVGATSQSLANKAAEGGKGAKLYGAAAKATEKAAGAYDAVRNSKAGQLYGKARETAYHAATDVRKGVAKAAPTVARTGRAVRNTAAITAGALYGISGGDEQSLAQGAALAQGLSGKTGKAKEKKELKTELSAAYQRKKKDEE